MDLRPFLVAGLCLLGGVALAPTATADVVVPLILCDLDGHCTCREITIRTPEPIHHHHRRCTIS